MLPIAVSPKPFPVPPAYPRCRRRFPPGISRSLNVAIECKRVSGLEPTTLEWAFELTKANMQTL